MRSAYPIGWIAAKRHRQATGSITRQARLQHLLVVSAAYLFIAIVAASSLCLARFFGHPGPFVATLLTAAPLTALFLVFARRQSPDRSPPSAAWMPKQTSMPVLRSSTRLARLLVFLPLAAWGGVAVGTAIVLLFLNWRAGDPVWPIMVVACLAAVVLSVSVAAAHAAIAWFNPRVHLRLACDELRPGDSTTVAWEVGGATGRIRRLRIAMEGRATQWDGRHLSQEVFARIELADTSDGSEIASGCAAVNVPVECMHSLNTVHRAISWSIQARGEVRRRPDVFEEFPIVLLPSINRFEPCLDGRGEHRVGADGDLCITTDHRGAFAPGETVTGAAIWRLDTDPVAIELRLFWYASGMMPWSIWQSRDVQIVAVQRFESPQPHGHKPFHFTLPQGPCSCAGGVVSLTWAMELVVLPFGKTQRLEFVVSPTGQTIDLESPHLPTQRGRSCQL